MNTYDTVAFGTMFINRKHTGHVIYKGENYNDAKELQSCMAARLNKWKSSYAVYVLKDGRVSSSISR